MLSHYTLAVTATGAAAVPTASYTKALLDAFSVGYVIAQSSDDVWFTIDGATLPVPTADAEVGMELKSTDQGITLTAQEFLDSKWVKETDDSRVQFVFREGNRWTTG